jgi:hypothetical protein
MTSIVRSLAAVACTFVLLAGCSESDSGLDADAAADETSSTTDAGDGDNEADGRDEAEQEALAEAEAAMQAQGFSAAGARCMVESMVSSGVSMQDLEQINEATPEQEFMDAAARAGAACASEIAGDIPEGAIDLANPVIREQFVRTFSQTTGLTIEQADCVAQYFIDNGVDYDALIAAAGGAEPDPETARQVTDAMESCA